METNNIIYKNLNIRIKLFVATHCQFDSKIAIRLVAVPLATAMARAMARATYLKIQLRYLIAKQCVLV